MRFLLISEINTPTFTHKTVVTNDDMHYILLCRRYSAIESTKYMYIRVEYIPLKSKQAILGRTAEL